MNYELSKLSDAALVELVCTALEQRGRGDVATRIGEAFLGASTPVLEALEDMDEVL